MNVVHDHIEVVWFIHLLVSYQLYLLNHNHLFLLHVKVFRLTNTLGHCRTLPTNLVPLELEDGIHSFETLPSELR